MHALLTDIVAIFAKARKVIPRIEISGRCR